MKYENSGYRLFRLWFLDKEGLWPLVNLKKPWVRGLNIAKNLAKYGSVHGPAEYGFYGWHELGKVQLDEPCLFIDFTYGRSADFSQFFTIPGGAKSKWLFQPEYPKVVLGTFIGFGKVAVHKHGARCQYAVPEYIVEPTVFDYATQLLPVAEDYGMKMISYRDAEQLPTRVVPWEIPQEILEAYFINEVL